jgi:hypothetical protein
MNTFEAHTASTVITDAGKAFAVRFGNCLWLDDKKIRVRVVARWDYPTSSEGAGRVTLFCDRAGNYYGAVDAWKHQDFGHNTRRILQKLQGRGALCWFADTFIADAHFREEARRAFESPEFEFMPALTRNEARKQKRARKKAAPARAEIAEQLQLATGLVAALRRMEAAPTRADLSEACRLASRLHTRLHAPETFKRVSAA